MKRALITVATLGILASTGWSVFVDACACSAGVAIHAATTLASKGLGAANRLIVAGCRPDGQLLQSFGQHFELLVCAEFVESVNADLNRSGVVVGYVADIFGSAHDHLCKRVVSHQALLALHLAAPCGC